MWDLTRLAKFPRTFRHFSAAVLKSNCHNYPSWIILYFGTDRFAVRPLDRLNSLKVSSNLVNNIEVVCPVEKRRPKDIKKTNKITTVRQFAKENGLLIHSWPLNKNNADFLSRFHLGIVVSFGHFIPSWISNSLPCGAMNAHPSLLPKWRGASPIAHALLNGDTKTGVSIIEVSPKKFDAGKILLQKEIQVPSNVTYEKLSKELSILSSHMLLDVLKNFTELKASAILQDEGGVTEAPKISKEVAYIKWSEFTCEHIDRLFRVVGHRFGLKCKWNDQVVKLETFVDSISSPSSSLNNASYGQPFYDAVKNVLYIKCKDGWVGWTTLKMQYRKSLTAKEFYNGYLIDKQSGKITSSLFQNMT